MGYDRLYKRLSPYYCVIEDNADSLVQHTIPAANQPADEGHAFIPLIFWLQSAGRNPSLCYCIMPSASASHWNLRQRDFQAYPEQSAQ